jgi:hypothetical protein
MWNTTTLQQCQFLYIFPPTLTINCHTLRGHCRHYATFNASRRSIFRQRSSTDFVDFHPTFHASTLFSNVPPVPTSRLPRLHPARLSNNHGLRRFYLIPYISLGRSRPGSHVLPSRSLPSFLSSTDFVDIFPSSMRRRLHTTGGSTTDLLEILTGESSASWLWRHFCSASRAVPSYCNAHVC